MSATARPSVPNRPSIVDGLAYVLPDVFIAEILPKLNLISTLNLAQVSKWYRDAVSVALPRTFDFEGVAGDLADHLVRLLDDDRVRSLKKERALELIGVHKNRLCEYACVQRNFEVLKWARNDLDLPWAPYPPGHVSDDVLVLRVLRETWTKLKEWWRVDVGPEEWRGVTMENGRVVKLRLHNMRFGGAVPAEIGQLTSLRVFWLYNNKLTSVPAEIGQLTSLERLGLCGNQLKGVPAEIGQLTSLRVFWLYNNKLTSLPAEIGLLTALEELSLNSNQLTSVPTEIGLLTSLRRLGLQANQLTSVPAEFGRLTSLTWLGLHNNQLTSVPAEIGQLTSLVSLDLSGNQLTSVPAAMRELRAAGCRVFLDDGVTYDIRSYMRAHG